MVIEYSGNVIRSILTDKREKYYDSKVSCGLLETFLKSLGELESGCEGRTGRKLHVGRGKWRFQTSQGTSAVAGALVALLGLELVLVWSRFKACGHELEKTSEVTGALKGCGSCHCNKPGCLTEWLCLHFPELTLRCPLCAGDRLLHVPHR